MHTKKIFITALIILIQGCTTSPYLKERYTYDQLPGWYDGNQKMAIHALKNSCSVVVKTKKSNYKWLKVCDATLKEKSQNNKQIRAFIEKHFTPYRITIKNYSTGHFTGYYQPSIDGSRFKTKKYNTPIYKRPIDLISKKTKDGKISYGRYHRGQFIPYYSRQEISHSNLIARENIIAWLPNRVERSFLQIQGSGQINLTDGTSILVGYDGQNGHPYRPIGRFLLKNNFLPREKISMQSIKTWLKNNPDRANEVLNYDPSFVFFKILKNNNPLGAQGIELTPKISLAVDWRYTKYGTPVWLDTSYKTSDGHKHNLRKLMIAQDTGGAIRGPNRGDVYWGGGSEAEYIAGHMNNKGKMWVLLPN